MKKPIKRQLERGERVYCRNNGGKKYEGVVKTIHEDGSVSIELNKPIRVGSSWSGEMVSVWKVVRTSSGSWDGCYYTETQGWYSSGRVYNRATGGSWLYSDKIENWKKEFMV